MAGPIDRKWPPGPVRCRVPKAPVLAGVLAVLLAIFLTTAAANTPPVNAGPAIPAGSVAQVVAGLTVVLALLAGLAWFLKRFSGLRGPGSGLINIVGTAAVGQRERVVLVEVGDTWLLLGVAPGQVRALHTMPRNSSVAPQSRVPADHGFASWLHRMLEKRKHD